MDSFLLEAHKKIVSSEIKQRNKEKKLSKAEQASLNQDRESDTRCSTSGKIPEVTNPVTKISAGAPGQNSHRKKGAENIVQLIADGIMEDAVPLRPAQSSDKAIPCDMISIESLNQNSSTDPLLSLAQLFDKADDAEYGAIRANQEEILRWYYYGKEFLNQVGVENIKYITTYSANSISELTNDKVQDIIDNFSEHNDNDNTDVEEVSSHMTEISAGAPAKIQLRE
ncbi:unnamed protein product [Rhizophagus irregularis]|nr:unnamed protein product [Rhizophagus irregularis]